MDSRMIIITDQPVGFGIDVEYEQASDICKIVLDNSKIERVLITAVLALMAIEHLFTGYRNFRQSMFLCGAMFAFIAIYGILSDWEKFGMTPTSGWTLVIIATLVFGLLSSTVDYLGLFLTGFYFGVILCAQVLFGYYFFKDDFSLTTHPDTLDIERHLLKRPQTQFTTADGPIMLFLLLFGMGGLCSILALFFPKTLTILSTSQTGAVALCGAIDYFIEDLRVFSYFIQPTILQGKRWPYVCWYTPYIWILSILLTFVGIAIQSLITARDYDHKYGWFNAEIVNTLTLRRNRRPRRTIRTGSTGENLPENDQDNTHLISQTQIERNNRGRHSSRNKRSSRNRQLSGRVNSGPIPAPRSSVLPGQPSAPNMDSDGEYPPSYAEVMSEHEKNVPS